MRQHVDPLVPKVVHHDRVAVSMQGKVVALGLGEAIRDDDDYEIGQHPHDTQVEHAEDDGAHDELTLRERARVELAQNDQKGGLERPDKARASLGLVVVDREDQTHEARPDDREDHEEVEQLAEAALERLRQEGDVATEADHLEALGHADEGAQGHEHQQQVGPVADLLQADRLLGAARVAVRGELGEQVRLRVLAAHVHGERGERERDQQPLNIRPSLSKVLLSAGLDQPTDLFERKERDDHNIHEVASQCEQHEPAGRRVQRDRTEVKRLDYGADGQVLERDCAVREQVHVRVE